MKQEKIKLASFFCLELSKSEKIFLNFFIKSTLFIYLIVIKYFVIF